MAADGRKRRWFALDVYVFDSDLGVGIRERFGPVGLLLWVGFLAACKRNGVEGQMRYSSDADALTQLALPGMDLVDEAGESFTLDEFFDHLARFKQVSRTRRKRIVDVRATRWERWQKSANRQNERERKSRSQAGNSRKKGGTSAEDARDDRDSDLDLDRDTTPKPPTLSGSHVGQHRNCRACGTNPRGMGLNLRAVPSGPTCSDCGGSGLDRSAIVPRGGVVPDCVPCEGTGRAEVSA